jgi:NAD(P)-dependent dehydrogenase (short-subunit alcohol dehydrogenase family)
MDLDLTGKHALVCGASQGIGLASAIELAKLGANVTLLARRADVLEHLADNLRSGTTGLPWMPAIQPACVPESTLWWPRIPCIS